ncbi:MAG: hypothetical protein IH872_13500 [Chloroflexi bacterium]|nr:hypothetical protein [Chloroflexota bacterium]
MAQSPEFEHISTDVIYLHLKRRVERELQFYSEDQFPSSDEWDTVTTDVKAAHPGLEKTREATRLANELWRRWKLPTLFFMRSHAVVDERLAALTEYGEGGNWTHWRDHTDRCQRSRLAANGFFGAADCDCGRGPLSVAGPTLASLDYALPNLPNVGEPLSKKSNDFFFWIIDDLDFRQLLGFESVGKSDVIAAGESHPDTAIAATCRALASLMETQMDFRLEGAALYEAFASAIKPEFPTINVLADELTGATPTMSPWSSDQEGLPRNFPPKLLPVLSSELRSWVQGRNFNPRVHLTGTGDSAELHIWWRKQLDHSLEKGPPPAFILDPTADPSLLNKIFEVTATFTKDVPSWPKNVIVHQWVDDLVTRNALGMRSKTNQMSALGKAARNRWFSRIQKSLDRYPRDWSIGIVTHKEIEDETREAIELMGFNDVHSMQYGAARGSNELENVKILVLLGFPVPDIDAFKEEAQAFLYDERQLDFNWEIREQFLDLTNGGTAAVQVSGYWNGQVAAYFRQKCQSGLYQALHRIQPYLVAPDDERHIFIYTNMPVQDVVVDELIRGPESQRVVDRHDRVMQFLRDELEESDRLSVRALAELLSPLEDMSIDTLLEWVQENGESLAAEAKFSFMPGHRGQVARFEKQRHESEGRP